LHGRLMGIPFLSVMDCSAAPVCRELASNVISVP
jgi:hypothetical protein